MQRILQMQLVAKARGKYFKNTQLMKITVGINSRQSVQVGLVWFTKDDNDDHIYQSLSDLLQSHYSVAHWHRATGTALHWNCTKQESNAAIDFSANEH